MSSFSFLERQSRAIRLWHWLTVLVVGLLLLTIIVSKTYLNGFRTGQTINNTLTRQGIKLSQQEIWDTVDALRNGIWTSHIYFGYALTALFVFRFMIEIIQGKLVKSLRRGFAFLKVKQERMTAWHFIVVKLIYLLFYGVLTTIVATGLWMAFYRDKNIVTPEQFHGIKEIHENCFIILLIFIFLHLVGIIRAERGGHKNIVSGMIHGQKAAGWEEVA